MVAISSLLVAFFILEIMLAATLVRSTTLASLQPSSEHEVSITRSFLGPQTILNYFENHCEKLLSKKKNPKRFKAGAASVEIKQTLSSDWLTYPGKKKKLDIRLLQGSSPKNESGDELHEFTCIFLLTFANMINPI